MAYPSDSDIVIKSISGDMQIREEFVRRFSNLVYWSIQGALKAKTFHYSQSDLEDLHNTVFVRIFEKRCKKLRQYRGENGCSLTSWIRLVTVRIVLDHIRSSRREVLTQQKNVFPIDLMPDLQEDAPETWALMEMKERKRRVLDGLKMLLPRDQLFLKLHFLEGRSIREVAALLGLSEANAHSVKHRAVNRLKTKIIQNGK